MVNVKRSGQVSRAEGVIRSQQILGKFLVYFMKASLLATPVLEWKLPFSHVRAPPRVGNEMSCPERSLIPFALSTLASRHGGF